MWTLCVLLTVTINHRDCISTWATEAECWAAGAEWYGRAWKWAIRSGGPHIDITYTCDPPVLPKTHI